MPFQTPKFTPREDGRCCRCERSMAETRDGLFCVPCLGQQIRHDTPIPQSVDGEDDDDEVPDANSIFSF